MSGILAYALHFGDAFNKNSLGAISEAAKVAEKTGGQVDVVAVGGDELSDGLCQGLGAYGASRVFRAKGQAGLAPAAVDAMAKVIGDGDYDHVVFGGGLLGFEIGAGLVGRLGVGVTMEVTGLRVEDGEVVAERPVLQDSAITDTKFVKKPGIVISRLNAFDIVERNGSAAEVVDIDVEYSEQTGKCMIVKRGEQRGEGADIEDADILVTGGRGLGAADKTSLCDDLAGALGGEVAATRAVVDLGWFPYSSQIGQTGKTVAPKLYVGLGVSGAIQHKVGMASSEAIVAINKDPNAPIFEFSDLGVVGDVHQIVPKLTEAIKAKRGG